MQCQKIQGSCCSSGAHLTSEHTLIEGWKYLYVETGLAEAVTT